MHFLDYGNEETVSIDQIRTITDELSSLPPAATKYSLKDLVAKPECNDKVRHNRSWISESERE